MTRRTPLILAAACGLALSTLGTAALAQTTKPAGTESDGMTNTVTGSGSDMESPATKPAMDADAKKLVDEMTSAYADLKSLQLAGTVKADFQAAGQNQTQETKFTGAYKSPAMFVHESPEQVKVVSNGKELYLYNVKENKYLKLDAPPAKVEIAQLPPPLPGLLQQQDISLLLALTKNPASFLQGDGVTPATGPAETIDGKSYPVLSMKGEGPSVKLALDPDTHLVRRMTVDLADSLKKQGVPDVKKAMVVMDYETSKPGADVADAMFTFNPPAGATEFKPQAQGQQAPDPAAELEGKPAPGFTLNTLDGKTVKLADLRGSVVVLDFWATWCMPCRVGLPVLDKLYQEDKAKGLKVFAVNLQEGKPRVQAFVDQMKLSIPVVMDPDAAAKEAYLAEAYPQTVVINKQGVITKVVVGVNLEEDQKAVDDAVKEALSK